MVGVGAGGRVSIFNALGTTHVLADVVGCYTATGGSTFTAVAAQRLLGTRSGVGGPPDPISPAAPATCPSPGGAPGSRPAPPPWC